MAKPKKDIGKTLYNPRILLSGKKMKNAARQLARIETRPALKAYHRQANAILRQKEFERKGLERLGESTGKAVGGAYDALKGSGERNIAQQQALAGLMNAKVGEINQKAQDNLNATQTGQLGGLVESLQAHNAPVGGSAAQAALAAQMQAQQQRQAGMSESYAQFANASGNAAISDALGSQYAGQMRGREQQAGIATTTASRIAKSNQDFNEAWREARGKQADQKALYGATMLKNLLSLRDAERSYMNERAAIAGDRAAQALDERQFAEDARHNRATEANDRADNSSSGSGDRADNRKEKRQDRRAIMGAIQNEIQKGGGAPKGAANKAQFFDAILAYGGVPDNLPWIKKLFHQYVNSH